MGDFLIELRRVEVRFRLPEPADDGEDMMKASKYLAGYKLIGFYYILDKGKISPYNFEALQRASKLVDTG